MRTRYRSPQTNGVIERFFGTLKYEHLYREEIRTGADLLDELSAYLRLYNGVRPTRCSASAPLSLRLPRRGPAMTYSGPEMSKKVDSGQYGRSGLERAAQRTPDQARGATPMQRRVDSLRLRFCKKTLQRSADLRGAGLNRECHGLNRTHKALLTLREPVPPAREAK